jgi:hypothetical protein
VPAAWLRRLPLGRTEASMTQTPPSRGARSRGWPAEPGGGHPPAAGATPSPRGRRDRVVERERESLRSLPRRCGRCSLLAWRYPDEAVADLDRLATPAGVPKESLVIGDGSSEILKLAADAFTGADRKLVMADPPSRRSASTRGRVPGGQGPLDAYAHDLAHGDCRRGARLHLQPEQPDRRITPAVRIRDPGAVALSRRGDRRGVPPLRGHPGLRARFL